nr:hypothetical protein [Pseudomonas syringae]
MAIRTMIKICAISAVKNGIFIADGEPGGSVHALCLPTVAGMPHFHARMSVDGKNF